MPIFSGIAAAILGFIFHRPGLIVVGCVWSALLLFITILTWHSWGSDEENACAPESVHRYFPCPEMLQEWAEKWCNLGFQAQVLHRYHSTVMLGISAAIFGAFGSWAQTKTTFFQGSMVAFHRVRSWAQCMEDVCQCVWNAPAHSFDRVKHTPFYESCTAEFPRFPFFDHHLPNPFDFCDDPHSMVASRRELRTVRSVQRWSGWLRENQTSLATRFGITTIDR